MFIHLKTILYISELFNAICLNVKLLYFRSLLLVLFSSFASSFVFHISRVRNVSPCAFFYSSLTLTLSYSTKKKTSETILVFLDALGFCDRASVSRLNSRADDDDKLYNWMCSSMRRECPPAGKSPDAESCRTVRSAFAPSLVDLRCKFRLTAFSDTSIKVFEDRDSRYVYLSTGNISGKDGGRLNSGRITSRITSVRKL